MQNLNANSFIWHCNVQHSTGVNVFNIFHLMSDTYIMSMYSIFIEQGYAELRTRLTEILAQINTAPQKRKCLVHSCSMSNKLLSLPACGSPSLAEGESVRSSIASCSCPCCSSQNITADMQIADSSHPSHGADYNSFCGTAASSDTFIGPSQCCCLCVSRFWLATLRDSVKGTLSTEEQHRHMKEELGSGTVAVSAAIQRRKGRHERQHERSNLKQMSRPMPTNYPSQREVGGDEAEVLRPGGELWSSHGTSPPGVLTMGNNSPESYSDIWNGLDPEVPLGGQTSALGSHGASSSSRVTPDLERLLAMLMGQDLWGTPSTSAHVSASGSALQGSVQQGTMSPQLPQSPSSASHSTRLTSPDGGYYPAREVPSPVDPEIAPLREGSLLSDVGSRTVERASSEKDNAPSVGSYSPSFLNGQLARLEAENRQLRQQVWVWGTYKLVDRHVCL